MASLLDSAHTVRLEESLIEATHELECSKNEALASVRMQHELQSQLDYCQVKYNTAISSKMSLENVKLDLELQVSGWAWRPIRLLHGAYIYTMSPFLPHSLLVLSRYNRPI